MINDGKMFEGLKGWVTYKIGAFSMKVYKLNSNTTLAIFVKFTAFQKGFKTIMLLKLCCYFVEHQ